MKENSVYALEGLDGTGKTTIGKLVSCYTNNKYMYCMDGNPLRSLRPKFDNQRVEVRFLYYLTTGIIAYPHLELLRRESDVFLDRSIASTIAYHRALGLSQRWISLVPTILIDQIDKMIYFTLADSEREKRLKERNTKLKIVSISDNKSLLLGKKIDSEYKKLYRDRTISIICDGKEENVIANEIIQRIYG